MSCGRVKTELFENADVTTSIYHQSELALGSLGITRGHVACLFSRIEVLMSNIVIEYQILLSNSEFRMSQRFCVDRDIFENGPRVDADLFCTDKKKTHFQKDPDTCGRGFTVRMKKLICYVSYLLVYLCIMALHAVRRLFLIDNTALIFREQHFSNVCCKSHVFAHFTRATR